MQRKWAEFEQLQQRAELLESIDGVNEDESSPRKLQEEVIKIDILETENDIHVDNKHSRNKKSTQI